MTAVKPRDIAGFLASRPVGVDVVLVFGQDTGLVRERAKILSHHIVKDLQDPFNAVEFTNADLTEPGRLPDEVQALSFMGGERLVRIRDSGKESLAALKLLFAGLKSGNIKPNALTVVEAGDLKKTNALRKLCEQSTHAASIACYADNARDISQTIKDHLSQEDISINDDALVMMTNQLGDDRGITLSAIEMLILYKGPKAIRDGTQAQVSLEDVRACLVDSAADATFEVIDAALSGEPKSLSKALYRAAQAEVSPIGLLRITQGKLLRLMNAQSAIHNGQPATQAIKSLKPPVFFGEQRQFEQQLRLWPLRAVEAAIQDAFKTDLAAKVTGSPQKELIERTLLRFAAIAARRK